MLLAADHPWFLWRCWRDPGDDIATGGILCEVKTHDFSGLESVEQRLVLDYEIHRHTRPAKGLNGTHGDIGRACIEIEVVDFALSQKDLSLGRLSRACVFGIAHSRAVSILKCNTAV